MVLKPSEQTPSSTSRMAELLVDVLPAGVLNVVCGGPDAGAALAAHPHVAMVSVTGFGSSGYGKDLGSYGLDGYTRIKHVAHAL